MMKSFGFAILVLLGIHLASAVRTKCRDSFEKEYKVVYRSKTETHSGIVISRPLEIFIRKAKEKAGI